MSTETAILRVVPGRERRVLAHAAVLQDLREDVIFDGLADEPVLFVVVLEFVTVLPPMKELVDGIVIRSEQGHSKMIDIS